jgi:hypothetical protein
MLRLLDQIDRLDLADLSAAVPASRYLVNMPRIEYAIDVVTNRRLPASAPGDLTSSGQVTEAKAFLAKRSPLRIPSDPTGFYPPPGDADIGFSPTDFSDAAKSLNVREAAIRAVSAVESGGGTGFGADGRPIIRFELHRFHSRTKGVYHLTHPHLSQSTWALGEKYHAGYTQSNEWSMLYGASMLRYRDDDAISSASWGMFQVMGENAAALGWPSPSAFAYDMCSSSSQHLQAFLAFIRWRHLTSYLATQNWASFANGYNGGGYKKNHYDVHMATAYAGYVKAGF